MISVQQVSHSYQIGKKQNKQNIPVLNELSFEIDSGEIIGIIGKSGSGKSTLLHILAGFLQPTDGKVIINGNQLVGMSEEKLAGFRAKHIGFIFQNFQLMPKHTAKENIELSLTLSGVSKKERQSIVKKWMEKLEIEHVADHYPSELSGGQQQRVAIARAMVHEPPVIFADEPTGNVDTETEESILSIIQQLNKEFNLTFVMITHDKEVASISDRVYTLTKGTLKEVDKDEIR